MGGSALTTRFIQGNFTAIYDPTIEDSYRKLVEVDGKAGILHIMDTAGQEDYSALRDQYMKTGDGFVICYSIVSPHTFESAKALITKIRRVKEDTPNIPMMLVGTKIDLEDQREVPKEQEALAQGMGCNFMETSAVTGANISDVFFELVRMMNKWRLRNPTTTRKSKSKLNCALL